MKLKNNRNTILPISSRKTNIFSTVKTVVLENLSTSIIIPNICPTSIACINGFTRELFNVYPIVQANYESGKRLLGQVNFIEVYCGAKTKNKIIVANIFCQDRKKNSNRDIHYGLLAYGMYEVSKYINRYIKNNSDFSVEIHAPKIGCGLNGGNWIFISDLINDIWSDQKFYIYSK